MVSITIYYGLLSEDHINQIILHAVVTFTIVSYVCRKETQFKENIRWNVMCCSDIVHVIC